MSEASVLTPETLTPALIKEYRIRQKWSQEELALRVGVKRSAVGQWEIGNRNPGRKLKQRLCAILSAAASNQLSVYSTVTRESLVTLQKELREQGQDWETIGFETCLVAYCDALNSLALSIIAEADGPAFRVFTEHFRALDEVRRMKSTSQPAKATPKTAAWMAGDRSEIYKKTRTVVAGSELVNNAESDSDPVTTPQPVVSDQAIIGEVNTSAGQVLKDEPEAEA